MKYADLSTWLENDAAHHCVIEERGDKKNLVKFHMMMTLTSSITREFATETICPVHRHFITAVYTTNLMAGFMICKVY